jgi:hypothetical protein
LSYINSTECTHSNTVYQISKPAQTVHEDSTKERDRSLPFVTGGEIYHNSAEKYANLGELENKRLSSLVME